MNAAQEQVLPNFQKMDAAIAKACATVAPSWPLDQAIAVNPWWTQRAGTMPEISARLAALGGVSCLMPKDYYQALWGQPITAEHLAMATKELGVNDSETTLLEFLREDEVVVQHWQNLGDLLDSHPTHHHKVAWHDEIVQHISQFCGLYFQYPERMQAEADTETGFYKAWLQVIRQDRGIEVLMGEPGLNQQFRQLADDPRAVFADLYALTGEHDHFEEYCQALLLEVNGWASWLAYRAWQDGLDQRDNNLVEQLLAIRIAWELALWRHFAANHAAIFEDVKPLLLVQFGKFVFINGEHQEQQQRLWVWQRALELSFQAPLQRQLLAPVPPLSNQCQLQAAFCIDVRSEPMRRALEAQSPHIQTLGFAGFFGLPLEYAPMSAGYTRPQLPGLLKPSLRASQKAVSTRAKAQKEALVRSITSSDTRAAAPSTFGLVEALGLGKAFNLLKDSLFPAEPKHAINRIDSEGRWILTQDGQEVGLDELVHLAASVLKAMGLNSEFAPRVLLLGHGSCSANNPQAAALDCGACGGQTGEVNVKVLAQLLNDKSVREGLLGEGIQIPSFTQFIPGLHNTTTDEIICFGTTAGATDGSEVHAGCSHDHGNTASEQDSGLENAGSDNGGAEDWQQWLQAATELAQQRRAGSLGLEQQDQQQLAQGYTERSRDWAELRPEWGLANNAGFIVAPRQRTRHINLQGRCFLHDYKWQQDPGFGILELIMTAPMVVTNWINLQYYASVTDNEKYGSGNKLLHNVVGGHIGVFEGNGGDLRIGLAKQSLHDGKQWRHQPVRLSVYIAAPKQAIEDIINKHQAVADLINNQWLYLFQLDDDGTGVWRFHQNDWVTVATRAEDKP